MDRFDKAKDYFLRHRGDIGAVLSALIWAASLFIDGHDKLFLNLGMISATIFGAGKFKSDDYQKAKQVNQ